MDPKTRKAKCRLVTNWIFIILLSPLYSISMYGISSSFHQFITNPTEDELDNSTSTNIEPGLGQSEFFYSILLSGTNVGAIIGGLVSGFLVRSVPYWYLWAVGLTVHTIGFVIHCVAKVAWLIMISRLFAGYLIGSLITLGFSYFTLTSEQYAELNNLEKGKKIEGFRLRNYLFSFNSIGYSTGLVVGSGATTAFAQFESVDQFRAIGWFNVAYGVLGLILLVAMFHGEIKCKKLDQCFQICPPKKGKDSGSSQLGVLPFLIILSLFSLSLFERMRFSFVQTLFNPIASDSFGIDERGASYFFLFLSFPQVGGSILLVILQCVKLSSQGITLLAVIVTMLGYAVTADWQTIPYDPCTEYSPFHNPGIVHDLNLTYGNDFEAYGTNDLKNWTLNDQAFVQQNNFTLPKLTNLKLLSGISIDLSTGSKLSYQTNPTNFDCKRVETCKCSLTCLRLTMDSNQKVTLGSLTDHPAQSQEIYQCTASRFHLELCVFLSESPPLTPTARIESIEETTTKLGEVEIESVDILPENLYSVAKNNCIEANLTGRECHWIPSSVVVNKECEDCPPICRSVHQTLTFAQFLIGNSLLVFASALQVVPVVSLLMNQSPEQIQGIVIGCLTAINAISRTVAPMLLDAVYEGLKKRNFAITMILAAIHIPFIIELIVLYPKLGPKTKKEEVEYSKLDTEDKGDD